MAKLAVVCAGLMIATMLAALAPTASAEDGFESVGDWTVRVVPPEVHITLEKYDWRVGERVNVTITGLSDGEMPLLLVVVNGTNVMYSSATSINGEAKTRLFVPIELNTTGLGYVYVSYGPNATIGENQWQLRAAINITYDPDYVITILRDALVEHDQWIEFLDDGFREEYARADRAETVAWALGFGLVAVSFVAIRERRRGRVKP